MPPPSRDGRSRRRYLAALAGVGAAGLAGCRGGSGPEDRDTHTATGTPTATPGPPRPRQPLQLTPSVLRVFCNKLGIAERPALKAMADCAKAAYASWPDMIDGSLLTSQQEQRLLKHFLKHHAIISLTRRDQRHRS